MLEDIHRQWFQPSELASGRPEPIVLLHEGLGSVSAWGGFPQDLADATGRQVLAYDRLGYGRSGPKPGPWPARFMHDEAITLHQVCAAEGLDEVVLVGHSDGATIALLYPSQAGLRRPRVLVKAIVSLSAHVVVEPICIEAIERLQATYDRHLSEPLARHHNDAGTAFRLWSDVWISDRFRHWVIEDELATVTVPVLAIQGTDDGYGTTQQLERLAASVSGPSIVHLIDGVDHWPHREAKTETLRLITSFLS